MSRWLLSSLAVAVCAALASSACGSDDDAPPSKAAAIQAVHAMQRAFVAKDDGRLCALMSPVARSQMALAAHGSPDDCPVDLRGAFQMIQRGGGFHGVAHSRVAGVAIDGDRATATLAFEDRGQVDVPLVRSGTAWRLDTFFGTPPREAIAEVRRGKAPSPDGGGAVSVADARGAPCLPLFADDYPQVSGGCEVVASSRRVALTIGTPFGYFTFGDCELDYRFVVDADGRSWTDSVDFHSPANNGCADVKGCENSDGDPLPWRGRMFMTGDGRVTHRMTACFDTCIGFYAGALTFELPTDRGGRARAVKASVGKSGLVFDGTIDLRGDRLITRPVR